MPIPSPKGKEKREAFMSRCVSALTKKGEGKDAAQRVVICNSQFKKAKATLLTDEEVEAMKFFRHGSDHLKQKKKKKKKKDKPTAY